MGITVEDAQKWANALRSGKYKQTTGELQSQYGYCCLGVACKIFIPDDKIKKDVYGFIEGGFPKHQLSSPMWLININEDLDDKINYSFSSLNDGHYFSFDEIADIIELVYIHKALD